MTLLEALAQPQVFPLVCGILGLAVGSFLNVVIHRLPKMMERDWEVQCAELQGIEPPHAEPLGLAKPRSRCPACGHKITAMENIPVLSWILLRGRCSGCDARISIRYPAVELVSAAAAAWCAYRFGPGFAAFGAMIFVWSVLAASLIDLDTQYLPDSITLPLLWLGLLLNLNGSFVDIRAAIVGAMAGYLSLWSVYWVFKLVTGKEGMGFGDFKLLAAIGAWMGWIMLPIVILLSSLVGAVVGIALILITKRGRNVPMPFGPFLGAAGVIALFWGPNLNSLLWSRLG